MTFTIILISALSVFHNNWSFWAKTCSRQPKIVAGAIGFSTSVMLYLGIFELFIKPMQLLLWSNVVLWFLTGIIVIAIIDWLLPHFHHHLANKNKSH